MRIETDFMAELMEIIAKLSNEGLFTMGSTQEEAIVGKPFQRRKKRSLWTNLQTNGSTGTSRSVFSLPSGIWTAH